MSTRLVTAGFILAFAASSFAGLYQSVLPSLIHETYSCFDLNSGNRARLPQIVLEFDSFMSVMKVTPFREKSGGYVGTFYSTRYGQTLYVWGPVVAGYPEGTWELRGSVDNITVDVGFRHGRFHGPFHVDNQKHHYHQLASYSHGEQTTDWVIVRP